MIARKAMLWTLAALGTAVVTVTGTADAGKPSGGGGAVDTGVIYFTYQQRMWSMNPDGSGKTMLPAGLTQDVQWAVPSRSLHGGHRWFVTTRRIAGETYPSGNPRRELFAVRDDAAVVVQLTDQADLEIQSPEWGPDDLTLSWSAGRLVGGVSTSQGIYVSGLTYSGGDVTGLASQPASPAVAISEFAEGGWPSFNHDWAPDATRLVIGRYYSGVLSVAAVSTGAVTPLATSVPAYGPVWSPDGARIACNCPPVNRYSPKQADRTASIRTIAPDGSGETAIVSEAPKSGTLVDVWSPLWSPNGTNLVYIKRTTDTGYRTIRGDIHRVTSSGGTPTNLTADLDTANHSVSIWGWR